MKLIILFDIQGSQPELVVQLTSCQSIDTSQTQRASQIKSSKQNKHFEAQHFQKRRVKCLNQVFMNNLNLHWKLS